jgi:anti-sigma B factor antagonist
MEQRANSYMNFVLKQEGRVMIVEIEGEFNYTNAENAKKRIDALTQECDNPILLNLAGVTYIDSSGLATLVSIIKSAKEIGVDVGLAEMTNPVKSVVRSTGIHKYFTIFDTVDEGLAKLSDPG